MNAPTALLALGLALLLLGGLLVATSRPWPARVFPMWTVRRTSARRDYVGRHRAVSP